MTTTRMRRGQLACALTAAAAVLLAFSVAAAPARAADTDTTTTPILPPDNAEPYTHPQQLIEVAPGRRLNLYCAGSGSPTVVMDAGFGNSAWPWGLVQPAVAGLTRVCSYDRAGEGWSDPGPLPRTSSAIVADLRALLSAGGEPPPYVLVGHSFGGLNATLYAYLHPEDLVGLVEVDPAVAGQDVRFAEEIPSLGDLYENNRQSVKQNRHCAALARTGALADPARQEQTGCTLVDGTTFDPALREALEFFAARPSQWVTLASEFKNFAVTQPGVQPTDTDEIEAARRSLGPRPLGALPLVVLQAGDLSDSGSPPPDVTNEIFRVRTDLLGGLVAQSRHGVRIVVPNSTHYIQLLQPQVVIGAIGLVVCAARAGRASPCPAATADAFASHGTS